MRRRIALVVLTMAVVLALLLSFHFEIAFGASESSTGWSRWYGGSGDERLQSIVQTADGGYAMAGSTDSFGSGGRDFWLVKADSSGATQWSKAYGGKANDRAFSLIQTPDGGFAMLGFTAGFADGSMDFWLVKTDSSGEKEWAKTYGGSQDDCGFSLIQTSDGGFALTGFTRSYGAGGGDFWLVKTDSSGNREWSKTYGGKGEESAVCVVQTNEGGFAFCGFEDSYGAGLADYWLVITNSEGDIQWSKNYGGARIDSPCSVIQTSDGGFVLAGNSESYNTAGFSTNDNDFLLVKIDSSGNELWSKTYQGMADYNSTFFISDDECFAAIETSDGGYALTGHTFVYDRSDVYNTGNYNMWLLHTDLDGIPQWNQTYGGEGTEVGLALIQSSDGGFSVAGYTDSYGSGGQDAYLVKTNDIGFVPEYPSIFVFLVLVALTTLGLVLAKRKYERKSPSR